MSSAVDAVAPKRQRGIDRVEAILGTAILLFSERDYSSVTMTEIAARSDTAIGSLYRFFPTKDALAAAILDRYGAHLIGALDQIVADVTQMTAAGVADALVTLMRDLRHERAAALSLTQVQEGGSEKRRALRAAMIARLSTILARGQQSPTLESMAWLLLYMLKAIRSLDQDRPDLTAAVAADACRLVAFHIETAWKRGP
jgi:AcrR family transcriptional regulator